MSSALFNIFTDWSTLCNNLLVAAARWEAVPEAGGQHEAAAGEEVRSGGEVVEEEPGGEGGHQQRQGGREPLQDVVSVLDGGRHQQTPACTAELSANIIFICSLSPDCRRSNNTTALEYPYSSPLSDISCAE